jgi:hypothetical protein
MATSPVPGKKSVAPDIVLMDFPTAIKEVTRGKKVSRKEWGSENEYMYISQDGWFIIHTGGNDHAFTMRDVDLKGEDYFVIK